MMYRILCVLTFLTGTCLAFAENHKFGTFNTRVYAVGDTDGKDWQIRGPHCSEVVKNYDLDVIGFQELSGEGKGYYNPLTGRTQLGDIKAWLPEYEFHAWDRDGDLQREYVAVAFKKARYECIGEGSFFISATPDRIANGWDTKIQPIPRVVGWLKLKEKATGQLFIFASAHTNNGWSLDGPYGSMLISRKIKEIAAGLPVMIVGDFNTRRGNADDQIGLKAYEASFYDAAKEVPADCNFSLPVSDRKVTWTYNGYHPVSDASYTGSELDYHFYRGMNVTERHIVTEQFEHQGSQCTPSDHFPVYVVAELTPEPSRTLYVDCNASPNGDGSLENPFITISHAVEVSGIDDTILVAEGVYNESVTPRYSISISGGYDAGFKNREGETIISGDGLKSPPINAGAYVSLRLNDLTIMGYKSPSGTKDGAIRFGGCDLIMENVKVENNTASVFGGGLCAYQAGKLCAANNITLRNCLFSNNKCPDGGAMAASVYGNLLIEGCSFENNTSLKTGSALYLSFGSADEKKIWFTEAKTLIVNSSFTCNQGGASGAMYINDRMPNIAVSVLNTTFASNILDGKKAATALMKGYAGAAIYARLSNAPLNCTLDKVRDSRLNMAHVTVCGNTAKCAVPENFIASAVNIDDGGDVKILNSIIAGNYSNGTAALNDITLVNSSVMIDERHNVYTDREGSNLESIDVSSAYGINREEGLANLCGMMDGTLEDGRFVPRLAEDAKRITMYIPSKSNLFGSRDVSRIALEQCDFLKEFGEDVNVGGLSFGKLDQDQRGEARRNPTMPGAVEYCRENSGVNRLETTQMGCSLTMVSHGIFTLRGESALGVISVYDDAGVIITCFNCHETETTLDISNYNSGIYFIRCADFSTKVLL